MDQYGGAFPPPNSTSLFAKAVELQTLETLMYLRICLKICEGCGSLWFRAQDNSEIYCNRCAPRLAIIPPAQRSRRSVRRGLRRRCMVRGGIA
jgi:hypothetical protein